MTADLNEDHAARAAPPDARLLTASSLPRRAFHELAFFLDLDGTLAPIVPTPDQARIPDATLSLLERLYVACAGSVAIVSGRDAADIDRLQAPLSLPYAALHGAQIKGPAGRTESIEVPPDELAEIIARIESVAGRLPGAIVERKALSVALHYRNAPRHEAEIRQLAASALAGHGAHFEVQEGKMVVEIKPRGASKGAAVERFMRIAPFQGRTPVFAGDDLTDESAFRIINAMNGISVKIGAGPTQALWRLDDPPALSAWLGSLFQTHAAAAAADTIKDRK
ncbi:trehalose-phosphatase [Pollutimonas bauzanensis]|uniref:Trehalose 6-phosphate phosphatase n=1 Tax=Pollutimonas bauzanensis TaxID=658167 RepID=A0A1M5VZY0_9BURK|nr:trehalose-phosphatase [Pollutimonas bauzanensis]SHH80805.1 trehalose 6-phosphate phosphatase [Pollutimonas bauzanensis]